MPDWGIAAFSAAQVDLGASDVPMTAAEQSAARGGPVTQVPVDLGGEGIAYNLSLPAGTRLHLTGPVLAAIYLGQITRWNDPAITVLNPGITLPPAPITVVHRSDGSGTTYIFSNYLSAVDPAWAARVGAAKTLNWPVGEGAEGNGGVATEVYRTPFSIGCIEEAYSAGLLLPFAGIRNQAGNYVTPSAQTVAADAAQKPAVTSSDFSIVNQPGADSYPISGYSWALVCTRQSDQATAQALVAMLDWLTHDGRAYAAANGYVTLPPQVQQLALEGVSQRPRAFHVVGVQPGQLEPRRRHELVDPAVEVAAAERAALQRGEPCPAARQAALRSGCSRSGSCACGCCGSDPVPAAPRCRG
jgi:phosphate transport system substrate-binding protein